MCYPGNKVAFFAGADFTPHVITVNIGEVSLGIPC